MRDPVDIYTSDSSARIARAVRRVEGMPGDLPLRGRVPGDVPWLYRVKIISSTRDGDNWRWTYQVRPQTKTAAGFGGWGNHPWFGENQTAYNCWEDDNGEDGIVSGYELDDGTNDTFITGIEPIPVGLVVWTWIEQFVDGEGSLKLEWRFCIQNMPIVECPEP